MPGVGIAVSPILGKGNIKSGVRLSSTTVEDGSASGTVVGTLSSQKLGTPVFTITGGADQAVFTIQNTNELVINEAVDFATKSSYEVEITATEGAESFVRSFLIIVLSSALSMVYALPFAF